MSGFVSAVPGEFVGALWFAVLVVAPAQTHGPGPGIVRGVTAKGFGR